MERFNEADLDGDERGNLRGGVWELGGGTIGAVSGNETHEEAGRRRGSRWGGRTRKTGVKSPQKFSTKPLIVLASGKRDGKPRTYNARMANSVPSLSFSPRSRITLRMYTCRKNSIPGKNLEERRALSHLPFSRRVCQSHDSTSICMHACI